MLILTLIIISLANFSIKKSNDSVLKQRAINTRDPSICDNIIGNTDKYLCYEYASDKLNNPELCKNINSESGKNICYKTIALHMRDIKVCDLVKSIDGYSREECYSNIANLLSNPKICDMITNSYSKELCLDYASR